MNIQKILRIGIFAGCLAYGYKACNDINHQMSKDLITARENAKMLLKQQAPEKYDSLINLGIGNSSKPDDICKWIKTENSVLDSLNNQSIYNKAVIGLKKNIKHIK